MIGRPTSFLGVAVSDRSVTCAEVSVSGDRRIVRRTATFVFPSDLSLESPDAAGQALAGFLRQKRFTASRCVVGVPARWLIAVEKEIPPADEEQTRATLRLQAERLAVAESGEVVFDFAGRANPAAASKVLLVGMLRQRLDKVARMMDAAGMSILAITSSGLALASNLRPAGGDGGVLVLSRSGGEMIWRDAGWPRMLRHVSFLANGHETMPIAPLGAELRRAVTMAQQNGDAAHEFMLLDGVGLENQHIADLSARLGVQVQPRSGLDVLGLQAGDSPTADPDRCEAAPAMSLALAGAKPERLPVDFLHSRLTPAPSKRFGRKGTIAIAAGALALIALIALFVVVKTREAELNRLNLENNSETMQAKVKAARATIDRLRLGRGYFEVDRRTPVLECLRNLADAFRVEDKIWVTTFTFKEVNQIYKGTLAGKAVDRNTVLAINERLQKSSRFAAWNMGEIREVDTRSREVSFSFTFDYNPGE
jgi:hypothetical protein